VSFYQCTIWSKPGTNSGTFSTNSTTSETATPVSYRMRILWRRSMPSARRRRNWHVFYKRMNG